MIFNSFQYALFLPLVLALHWLARSHRRQNLVLLVASYAFYAAWDVRFLGLMLLTTAVDFTVGRRLGHLTDDRARRRLLVLSLAANLGVLGTFKYLGFFADSAAALMGRLGLQADVPTLKILLPVGISFYTFHGISYTVDVYRRHVEPTSDLLAFAVFVAYFPQLVAGPIGRADAQLPQFERSRPRATREGGGHGRSAHPPGAREEGRDRRLDGTRRRLRLPQRGCGERPLLRPETLVIALSIRDLNDEWTDQAWALRAFPEAPGRRRHVDDRDVFDRTSDAARDRVALVRTRHVWRLAVNNVASFIDLLNTSTPPALIPFGDHGEALLTKRRTFRQDPSGDRYLFESVFNDYRVGGVERQAVEHMVRAIRRTGGSAVLVATPYDEPSVLKVISGGRSAIRRYERMIEDLASDLGVPLIDGQPPLGSRTMLYDIHHLNADGRTHLSDMVADVLERQR